jgi:hypothetical protein
MVSQPAKNRNRDLRNQSLVGVMTAAATVVFIRMTDSILVESSRDENGFLSNSVKVALWRSAALNL